VLTGGEPLLQVDVALIEALHAEDFEIAVESNGTVCVPKGIDWICISPKAGADWIQRSGHELKLVFPQSGLMPDDIVHPAFEHLLLQPMDGLQRLSNTRAAIAYCQANPRWRLSVQTHKVLEIR
jgi:organic radical activating enzyme